MPESLSPQDWIVRAYDPSDEEQVIRLWRECNLVFPQNDPHRDIRLKQQFQPELFLVGTLKRKVVATVMAGYDGHRGWINYLGVSPEHQKRGLGRAVMEAAEQRLRALGCPKINLQVRNSNVAVVEFYRSIGFTVDDVMSMGKRL